MKKFITVSVLSIALALSAFADRSVVIDFNLLKADSPADAPIHNQRTLTDFSNMSGSSFTVDQKRLMRSSLAIATWNAKLNSSARNKTSVYNTYVKQALVQDNDNVTATTPRMTDAQDPTKRTPDAVRGKTVLGVRVEFPSLINAASYVMVTPPFEIQAYSDLDTGTIADPPAIDPATGLLTNFTAKEPPADPGVFPVDPTEMNKGRKFEFGYGVVKNVGVIKSIDINVFAANNNASVDLILEDQNYKKTDYRMEQSLMYDGWTTLTWNNPNYTLDARNRDLRPLVLYPVSIPYIKFVGLRINRAADAPSGDLVVYFKDIIITYDKATLNLNRDIDDESVWGVVQEREKQRVKLHNLRNNNQLLLEHVENLKVAQER